MRLCYKDEVESQDWWGNVCRTLWKWWQNLWNMIWNGVHSYILSAKMFAVKHGNSFKSNLCCFLLSSALVWLIQWRWTKFCCIPLTNYMSTRVAEGPDRPVCCCLWTSGLQNQCHFQNSGTESLLSSGKTCQTSLVQKLLTSGVCVCVVQGSA